MTLSFNFNPTDFAIAIRTILRADATLEGADYLNGTQNIFTNRAPRKQTGNFIVIETPTFVQNDMMEHSGVLRVFVYVPLLGSGQIDARGNKILDRCQALLNNISPAITGGTCQPLYGLGIVPLFYNQSDSDETLSRGVVRFNVNLGINS